MLPAAPQWKLTRIPNQTIAPTSAEASHGERLSHHGLGFSLRIDVPGFAPFELAWFDVLSTGALLTKGAFAAQSTFRPFEGVEGSGYGLGILRCSGLLGHAGEVLGSKGAMYLAPGLGVEINIIAEGGDDAFAPANYIGDSLNAVPQ
jgi:hypothetical protein